MPYQLYEQSNAWKDLVTKNPEKSYRLPQHGRAITCIELDNLTKGFSYYGTLGEYTKVPGKNVYHTRLPIGSFDVLEAVYFSSPVPQAWLEFSPSYHEKTGDLETKVVFIDANGDGKDLPEPLPVAGLRYTNVDLYISARPMGKLAYSLPTPTFRGACVRSDFRQRLVETRQSWLGYNIYDGLVQNQ